MGRRVVITVVVAVAALAAGVGIGAALFGGDDSGGDSGATSTTTSGPGNFVTTTTTSAPVNGSVPPPPTVDEDDLEGEALALAQAINRAADLTYHAVFEGTTAGASGGGVGTLRVEVWRSPPRARRDTVLGLADQTIESVEVRLEDEVVGCVRIGADAPFDCRPNPDPEADPSAPLFDSVDPRAGTVTARDDVAAGTPVRCWIVVTATGAPQEACFDEAGIPAVIDGGDGHLERTAVDTSVPDDVFTPPTD